MNQNKLKKEVLLKISCYIYSKKMKDFEINKLIDEENKQLNRLKEIVTRTMEDEKLILENLIHPPIDKITTGQRISDKVAKFGGSWAFIISFFIVLFLWILFNSISATQDTFDPYPFILMNLILSCIAALQAPIIMMSQNRQEEKDRKRSENDYLINLKAELEIRSMNEKIDLLQAEQLKLVLESQARQLDLLKKITAKLEIQN